LIVDEPERQVAADGLARVVDGAVQERGDGLGHASDAGVDDAEGRR
jgi:hypothetical protein